MARLRAAVLGALITFTVSAGCGGNEEGAWKLRPNVTEVLTWPAGTISASVITDVDRDGDRIILLRPSNSSASTFIYAYLSLSEDLGKTWRHVQVRREIATELGGDTHQIGVHLQDGKVYLMLSRDIGSSLPAWAVFEVDMATGDTTEVPIGPTRTGWFSERRPDGHLRYGLSAGSFGISPHTLFELDPSTGEGTYENFPCTGMACTTPYFHSSDGGETWDGYTQVQPGLPVCVTHWDVASVTATEACVTRPQWPATDFNYLPTVTFRGATPYMVWSTGEQGSEQAYATALLPGNPPTVSETLLLGPGTIAPRFRTGTFVRRRFARFELVEKSEGVGRLTRLAASGPEQVSFPVTPCTVDAGCGFEDPARFSPTFGYGQVQWLVPLEDGSYLVFYTTVLDASDARAIYVAREQPSFGPITGGVPPPVPTVDLPAGAQPMNALEKACAVFANCQQFDTTVVYKQCLARWITETARRPGLDAARARFIAAATTCASLDAVAASGCPLECTESGGTCGAGGTGPCSTEVAHVPGDCNTCDLDGNFLSCSSTRTFQVACGGGTVCASGYGCALSGPNACDAHQPSPGCVGDAARDCASPSQVLTLAHCELAGATCSMPTPFTATCVPTSGEGACSVATYGHQCASGTHLLTCGYGQIKYVACSELGHAECVVSAGGAICR